jgi:subtilase family serine protease
MHQEYGKLQPSPGPEDVFDYQVGELRKRGIDGTGTTIALIEGWGQPALASFIASHDKMLGLPNPQITTTRATSARDDSPWVTAVGGSVPSLSSHTGRVAARPAPDARE